MVKEHTCKDMVPGEGAAVMTWAAYCMPSSQAQYLVSKLQRGEP